MGHVFADWETFKIDILQDPFQLAWNEEIKGSIFIHSIGSRHGNEWFERLDINVDNEIFLTLTHTEQRLQK